jgi:hypothetical protein
MTTFTKISTSTWLSDCRSYVVSKSNIERGHDGIRRYAAWFNAEGPKSCGRNPECVCHFTNLNVSFPELESAFSFCRDHRSKRSSAVSEREALKSQTLQAG